MNYSSLMRAVVSPQGSILYHTDASAYQICCFHVQILPTIRGIPQFPYTFGFRKKMWRVPLAKMLNFTTSK